MSRWIPLVAPALIWALSVMSLHAEVQFISRPLPAVQDMAARQGKLFFVHFTAQWCMPCRWMEENTFSDPALSSYVDQHYIAVKMDIDEAYGLNCKEEYGVQLLPTILVFNAKGELLGRRESSVEAGPLLDMLQMHRLKEPAVIAYGSAVPSAPSYPQAPSARPDQIAPGLVTRPALTAGEAPMTKPIIMPSTSHGSAPVETVQPQRQTAALPYTVQTGVFGDYNNALNEVSRQESLLRRPVTLTAVPQDGKTAYKITVGSFSNRQNAEDYLHYLLSRSISGFVRQVDGL